MNALMRYSSARLNRSEELARVIFIVEFARKKEILWWNSLAKKWFKSEIRSRKSDL